MDSTPLDPFWGSPIVWVLGFVLVLGLLWLLFGAFARSGRTKSSEAATKAPGEPGPTGAAWPQKHPDAREGGEEGGPEIPRPGAPH